MKQWEPDWLAKVIAKVEAASPRRPAEVNTRVVQPQRLDWRLSAHGVQMRYRPMTEDQIDWAASLYAE